LNLTNINKVLIIRISSLGDILLTTPLVRSLKKINPNCEIDFLLLHEFKDIYLNNPHIGQVIEFDKSKNKELLINRLKKEKYNLIIDLQNSIRSKLLRRDLGLPAVKFKKPNIKKFLLVKFKINLFDGIRSIPEMYSDSLNDFDLDEEGLDLFINEETVPSLKESGNRIGFCPGAKHFTKRWPKDNYVDLGNILTKAGYEIVLIGGRDDSQLCSEISSRIPGSLNCCSDNNLYQSALDMKMCRLIVCNDTGLMHTATAMKVPVVTIFGSSVKEFGFSPYKSKSAILENNSLSGSPCTLIGRNKCPRDHFKCMLDIGPELVFKEIEKFVNSN